MINFFKNLFSKEPVHIVNIAKDFSKTPAGLYLTDGNYSAAKFRETFLLPYISNMKVEVILDGVEGYASNWLEASFAGLMRYNDISYKTLKKNLIIKTYEPVYKTYANRIWAYIEHTREEFVD